MKHLACYSFVLAALICCAASDAAPPVAYKATLLHPIGGGFTHSDAWNVSGGFQVGITDGPGPHAASSWTGRRFC